MLLGLCLIAALPFELEAQSVQSVLTVGQAPWSVNVNAVTNKIYIGNIFDNTVSVIDGSTNAIVTVPVGPSPWNVAINPVTNKIYTANGGGTVTVIDGSSSSVAATIAVPDIPESVVLNPATNKIYVLCPLANVVDVIDGATNTITARVATDNYPTTLAVDPLTNKIYVANTGQQAMGHTVTVIDGATNTTQTVQVGNNPVAIAINAATNKIYIANSVLNSVTVIDGATNTTQTVAVGNTPLTMAVDSITNKVFVANLNGNNVTVIDGATNATSTIAAGSSPSGVEVNELTGQVFVANFADGNTPSTVTVIDEATLTTRNISAGLGPEGIGIDPVTNKIYVCNRRTSLSGQLGNTVTVLDGATNNTSTLTTLGVAPYHISLDPVSNTLYMLNPDANTISVVDVVGKTVIATVAAGAHPFSVATNPVTNMTYAANNQSSNLTVINGVTNTAQNVAIGSAAYVVAANPVTNKVYAASPTSITVLDGATNAITTLPIAYGPFQEGQSIDINPVTNKVYVANLGSNNVTVLDGATNTATYIPVATTPYSLAVNPVTNKIYVITASGSGTLNVINGVTNQITATVSIGELPQQIAINHITNRIYITNQGPNAGPGTVSVVDGSTDTLIATISLGTIVHSVSVNPLLNLIYASNSSDGTVSVIDGITNKVLSTVSTGLNPLSLTVNPFSSIVFAAASASSNLTFITPNRAAYPANLKISGIVDANTVGLNNVFQTKSAAPSFSVAVDTSVTKTPSSALYYQVDGASPTWQRVTGGTAIGAASTSFNLQLGGIPYGLHTLYTYAAFGNEVGLISSTFSNGATLKTTAIAACYFLVVPGGTAVAGSAPACTTPAVASTPPPMLPTVTSIAPASGPAAGGTSVVITGTNFTGVTAVSFGSTAATSFTVNSSTQITATIPAGTGTVDTTVTTGTGTSAISSADRFTYIAAVLLAQTIVFPQPVSPAFAGTAALLGATANSGLPITYTIVSGPARVSGNVLTYLNPGVVTVQADQPGNGSYAAAASVQRVVNVSLLTEPIGTTSPTISTVVPISTAGTLAAIGIFTQGAAHLDFNPAAITTCGVGTTYAAGQSCIVSFTFTPTRPGQRFGGITLTTSTGTLLGNAYPFGLGVGPQLAFTPATQTILASNAVSPSGAAVDGNGNLFVADYLGAGLKEISPSGQITVLGNFAQGDDVAVDGSGNVFVASDRTTISEILAVNGSVPANPVIRTLYTGFDAINGMKVDQNGNVLVANSFTQGASTAIYEILAVNGTIPSTPTVVKLGSGYTGPTGVASDPYGNIFISDELAGAAIEMLAVNGVIPATPVLRFFGVGVFGEPTNIGLDANGDVFITDLGNHNVEELVAINGTLPPSPQILTLGTGFSRPAGLGLDSAGNIYVADYDIAGIVKLDVSDPPSLTFASTQVGSTSTDSPKSVTLFNNGNADFSVSATSGGVNPIISAGYTLGSTSTCPRIAPNGMVPAPLSPGSFCTDVVSFTPVAAGPDSGTLVTTDNNLNVAGATQTIHLYATGLAVAPTILFAVPDHIVGDPPFPVAATSNSPGAFTYIVVSGPATVSGNIVTVSAAGTVILQASQAASGAYAAATATASFNVSRKAQTIQFSAPTSPVQTNIGPITLVATASSGLPVSFSVVSGPGTVNGSILTINAIGTIVVAADQLGNATYSPAPQVTRTITVLGGPAGMTLTAAPNPVFLRNAVFFTATFSTPSATATGTVSFMEGAALVASGTIVNGVATASTSSLTLGTHAITAVYGGDNTFAAATSNIVAVTVQDFALTATSADLTIIHGGVAHFALQLNSIGGLTTASAVTFSIAQAPENSTITFAPQTVPTGSGATQIDLTIQTPDYPTGPWNLASFTRGSTWTLAFLAGVFALLPIRRRRIDRIMLLCVLACLTSLSGCGSGWRAQKWSMQVTATAGQLTHTTNLTLTSVCRNGQPSCPVE